MEISIHFSSEFEAVDVVGPSVKLVAVGCPPAEDLDLHFQGCQLLWQSVLLLEGRSGCCICWDPCQISRGNFRCY